MGKPSADTWELGPGEAERGCRAAPSCGGDIAGGTYSCFFEDCLSGGSAARSRGRPRARAIGNVGLSGGARGSKQAQGTRAGGRLWVRAKRWEDVGSQAPVTVSWGGDEAQRPHRGPDTTTSPMAIGRPSLGNAVGA